MHSPIGRDSCDASRMDAEALRRAALITLGQLALARIQREHCGDAVWTRPRGGRQNRLMPLDLTDAELATAAQACRAMAHQEGERARKMENPTVRGPIEAAAQRYAALAQKLEAVRRR